MKTKIIAHRGASYLAPENTLSSVNLAWSQKSKYVEIDVQLTLDNEVVVFHDVNLKRIVGIDAAVSELNLKTLKKYDVGVWKDKKYEGERMPILDEVLDTIPKSGILIVEVKSDLKSVPFIVDIVRRHQFSKNVQFISFDFEVIKKIKELLPEAICLWLLDLDYSSESLNQVMPTEYYLNQVISARLDGVNVWGGNILDDTFLNTFKAHHLLVYVWTVNELDKIKYFINMGVDAVATDNTNFIQTDL